MRALWTLRFLACAGLAVLLSRLPAFASVTEVFLLTLTGTALVLVVLHGSRIAEWIADTRLLLTHPGPWR